MMRSAFALRLAIAGLAAALTLPSLAQEHAEGAQPTHFPMKTPQPQAWTFATMFGRFDPAQLQRGFQVYREVCRDCHSLKMIAFRNLADPGGPDFTAAEVAALAAEFQVTDGPNEAGDMFERPGKPSDHLPNPYPNVEAAANANGGAAPPDLSVMAKARGVSRGLGWGLLDFFTQYQEGGPDYIHALLTGFGEEPPAGVVIPEDTHYNPYFNAAVSLKMQPPLEEDQVTYSDGSPQTVDQYSRDVAAFLMWAAEPHLVERKRIGFQVFLFLVVFGVLMYLTKKRVWAQVAH